MCLCARACVRLRDVMVRGSTCVCGWCVYLRAWMRVQLLSIFLNDFYV